jgi:hypothetical protein
MINNIPFLFTGVGGESTPAGPESVEYADLATLLADTTQIKNTTGYVPGFGFGNFIRQWNNSDWLVVSDQWDGVTSGQTVGDLAATPGITDGVVEFASGEIYRFDGANWVKVSSGPNLEFSLSSLDIGDAISGTVDIENTSDERSAALTGITIGAGFTVSPSSVVLAPLASATLTVEVTLTGEQSGTLEADSSDGPLSLPVTSDYSYLPASIAGYLADYDAQSQPVVADDTTITALTDRSGNGYDATGVTGTAKYRSGVHGINMFPALRFDSVAGANSFTLPTALRTALSAAGEAEYFAVVVATNTNSAEPLGIGNAGSSGLYPIVPTPWNLYTGFCCTTVRNPGNTTLTLTSAHVMGVWHSSTQVAIQQNGTQVGSAATDTFNVGTTSKVPAVNSGSISFKGKLGQVIVFSRVLTSEERAAMVAFLKFRWGIA